MLTIVILFLSSFSIIQEHPLITSAEHEPISNNHSPQNLDTEFDKFLQQFDSTSLPIELKPQTIESLINVYSRNSKASANAKKTKKQDQVVLRNFLNPSHNSSSSLERSISSKGLAGPQGPIVLAGPQGPVGPAGRQGPLHGKSITPLYRYTVSKDVIAILFTAANNGVSSLFYELSIATFDDTGTLLSQKTLIKPGNKDKSLGINTSGIIRISKADSNASSIEYQIVNKGQIALTPKSMLEAKEEFDNFFAAFEETQLPFKHTIRSGYGYHGYSKTVQTYLDKIFNNSHRKFSRSGAPTYRPINSFRLEGEVFAVVYSLQQLYSTEIHLALFDINGELIEHNDEESNNTHTLVLSSSRRGQKNIAYETTEIDESGCITVNQYNYNFKRALTRYFYLNRIVESAKTRNSDPNAKFVIGA